MEETNVQYEAPLSDLRFAISGDDDFAVAGMLLGAAVVRFEKALEWILARASSRPQEVYAGAVPYLRLAGYVLGGWQMARSLECAKRDRMKLADSAFLDAKIATALFYMDAILPQTSSLLSTITRGSARVMVMDPVDS
jgi:3-(methylthio)propanoyl-CoA dehydrogenase